jgi:hypothetical protein
MHCIFRGFRQAYWCEHPDRRRRGSRGYLCIIEHPEHNAAACGEQSRASSAVSQWTDSVEARPFPFTDSNSKAHPLCRLGKRRLRTLGMIRPSRLCFLRTAKVPDLAAASGQDDLSDRGHIAKPPDFMLEYMTRNSDGPRPAPQLHKLKRGGETELIRVGPWRKMVPGWRNGQAQI